MEFRSVWAGLLLFALGGCREDVVRLLPLGADAGADGTAGVGGVVDGAAGGAAVAGGAPTTGGGGDGGGGAAGGTTGAISIPSLVEDFADCDDQLPPRDGRSGSWFHFTTPTSEIGTAGMTVGMPPDTTWGTQTCGVFLTGSCPTCTAVGLGVQLNDGKPYDLTPFVGVRLSFESDGDLWVVLKSELNGSVGYSTYVLVPATGNRTATREVYWSSMVARAGFYGLPNVTELQFTVGEPKRANFGMGLHSVELF